MLFFISFAYQSSAQFGEISKGFKLLDYYGGGEGKSQTNPLKGEITGGQARPQPNALVQVEQGVRIQNYLEDGRTNLIATAPDCFVDYKNRVAYSASRLAVETANGQLTIQGVGFFYQQTNFNLTISNQVETTIHRELIRSTSAASLPPLTRNNPPGGTNQLMKIFSDHFFLESPSNLALYSGHVRVDDPQMEMTCESLTIRASTNGVVESIVADQNVLVTNKLDKSWAMGDRAVYSLEPEKEVLVLNGQAAQWQEGERRAKAGMFTFDRRANTLRAEQKPAVRLPRSAIHQHDWFAGSPVAPTNTAALTNQFVDISAEEMLIQLPTTNQPARRITVRTNVVIISAADQSRATSDEAVYSEAGNMELSGHAIWQSDQRLIKGDRLLLDRTNQIFRAQRNAYLKMPLSALGRPTPAPSARKKPGLPEMVEVVSEDLVYQPNALTFHEHVRANYFQGENLHSWMTCGSLSLGFQSNRIESVAARRSVSLEEPGLGTNATRRIGRKLNCENLTLQFYTNGLLQSLFAETNVVAQQTEVRPDRPWPINTQLSAGSASMSFFSHTNQVREIVAERNVAILQETKSAHGGKAVYSATNNSLELTEQPTAETPLGRITEAEVLIWDRTHNTLKGRGKKVIGEGMLPGKGTNRAGLLRPK